MSPQTKRRATLTLAIIVIVAACAWIYFTQTSETRHNDALHRYIGEALAEQTAALVGNKGKIVTLAIETKEWQELKTQLTAFKATLKKLGNFEVRAYEMDTKDGRRFI